MTCFLVLLGIAPAAWGAPIYRYDGSYNPYSVTPPSGQSTWSQGTATILPTPNNPSSGIANFTDANTAARASIFKTFPSDIRSDVYFWQARVRLDAFAQTPEQAAQASAIIGIRDEFGAGGDFGKALMLGFFPDADPDAAGNQPGLRFTNSGFNFNSDGTLVNLVNYADSAYHTFRVEKYLLSSVLKVQVYIDGVPQFGTPLNYATMTNASSNTNGFGYYGSTPGTSTVYVDYINLNAVPEPTSGLLLMTGMILSLRCFRTKRSQA